MCKIKIKNFGPIKGGFAKNEGFIDINKITIFTGDQGTGKSTITKLISTLTWLEKALVRGDLKEKEVALRGRFVKRYCAYQNIHNYFSEKTEIDYRGRAYSFGFKNNSFKISKSQANGYKLPKIMYVPAERNFISVVDKPSLLKNLPKTLYTFLDEFEKAKQQLTEAVKLPVGNVKFAYQKLNKMASIVGDDYKIRLSEASSGYQSLVPLYIVTRYLTTSLCEDSDTPRNRLSIEEQKRIRLEIDNILANEKISAEVKEASLEALSAKFTNSCFINIVEEPEQNLYPVSQKNILFKLLEFANSNLDNQLIITTHSPYIISYLTFAIKGFSLLKKMETAENQEMLRAKLTDIIPWQACLSAEKMNIYEIYNDGTLKKLGTYDGLPVDDNLLNNLLAESNSMFDQFFEIEDLCQ